jgi:hypothetical protein
MMPKIKRMAIPITNVGISDFGILGFTKLADLRRSLRAVASTHYYQLHAG